MEQKVLDYVMKEYINRSKELHDTEGHDEGYKWNAVGCFQKYWDIDAQDFVAMLTEATKESGTLLDSGSAQALQGIFALMDQEDEVEFVRESFRTLLQEDDGDLEIRQNRVDEFVEQINQKIEQYHEDTKKYLQTISSTISFLALWRPLDNYFYKPKEANEWAAYTVYGDDFGSGSKFSLKKYYRMCDELHDVIKSNRVLMRQDGERLEESRQESDYEFDDDMHIMAYDIIHCANSYSMYGTFKKYPKKERMKQAKISASTEKVEIEIVQKKQLIANVKKQGMPLPDMTNHIVFHKRYGEGKVTLCEGGKLKAEFPIGEKSFQYPEAFYQEFLTVKEEDDIKSLKANDFLSKQIAIYEDEVAKLEMKRKQILEDDSRTPRRT